MALRSRSVLARGGETAERNPSVGRPRAPLRTAAACFVAGLVLLLCSAASCGSRSSRR